MKEKIILLWCCLCFFQSCFKENAIDPEIGPGGEEMEVSFIPRTAGGAFAEPGVEMDSRLEEVDVLVCKDGEFQYYRPCRSSGSAYKSTLKVDNNITLYFIVNSRELLEQLAAGGVLDQGKDWESEVRPALIQSADRLEPGATSLPMWGVIPGLNIVEGETYHLGAVALLRSVASVDVLVSDNSFELTVAYLYYAPSTGLIAPSEDNVSGEEVKEPEMPDNSECVVRISANEVITGSNAILSTLYLYENGSTGTSVDEKRRRTRLVIGGRLGNANEYTYYPLDFRDGSEWLTIVRNHKYFFEIPDVSGSGYEDPDEAAMAAPVIFDYEVIDWVHEEGRNVGVDGIHYLSISGKKAYLGPIPPSTTSISVSTNVAHENIGFVFEDGVSFNVIDYDELTGSGNSGGNPGGDENEEAAESPTDYSNRIGGIESELFRVELLKNEEGKVSSLLFTALQDWKETNKQKIILTAGRIRFLITIMQMEEEGTEWVDGGDFDMN